MIQYRAIKEFHYQRDVGEYIVWGIKGFRSSDETPGTAAVYIPNVFQNEQEAVDFAQLCTRLELSLLHLHDVIEDYLER